MLLLASVLSPNSRLQLPKARAPILERDGSKHLIIDIL